MIDSSVIKSLPASLLGRKMQLSFVVPDMEEAVNFWTKTMKIGPFIAISESLGPRKFIHRGKESPVDMSVAYSYCGDTQIEIITQNNDAPSPYTEFYASGRQGVHHIAFWPDDFAASSEELEKLGFVEVCSILGVDNKKGVIYYEGPTQLGLMVEIAPFTAERSKYFNGIKALATNWDGDRPFRVYRNRAEYMDSKDCPA